MKKCFIFFTVLLASYSLIGCSLKGTSDTPTEVSDDNQPTGGAVEVVSTSSFTDDFGGYYVMGEVINNLPTAVTSIELIISITDASGASLLKDEGGNIVNVLSFFTMLTTLDTGETSPFSFYFDTASGIPANYAVTVLGFEAGVANRGQLQYENVQIIDDDSGYFILTGELVNQSSSWVHISGLAGGVLDDSNVVLSADWTGTYTAALAPSGDPSSRDRTPFYITFPVPGTPATQWSIWWDADVETAITDYPLGVEVTNSYYDEYGSAHLVGTVTNNSDTALSSLIVAGLYAEDGTVLDASYSFLPATIQPRLAIPFDISYFNSVNWNEEQAALVDHYSVQYDPWNTFPPGSASVSLTPSGETIQKEGTTWTVSGSFTNTTSQDLSGVTIMVSIYDANTTLVAMGYAYSYPVGDAYLPGDSGTYEIIIYLAPDMELSGLTTQTFILADISQ